MEGSGSWYSLNDGPVKGCKRRTMFSPKPLYWYGFGFLTRLKRFMAVIPHQCAKLERMLATKIRITFEGQKRDLKTRMSQLRLLVGSRTLRNEQAKYASNKEPGQNFMKKFQGRCCQIKTQVVFRFHGN